jgi:hypothetical protein
MEIPVYLGGVPASFSNLQRLAHKIQGMVSVSSVDCKIIKADLIVASCLGNEFLEYVAEWDNVFANFYHPLAPSGHIIFTSPHFFLLHDFWRPTPYAIRCFAQKHGFAIETETPLGTGWDGLGTPLARQSFLPRARSFTSRFVNRVCQVIRRWLFPLLRLKRLQNSVVDRGPFCLANFIVLRKADP